MNSKKHPNLGCPKLYLVLVQQFHLEADLDFLVGGSGAAAPRESH